MTDDNRAVRLFGRDWRPLRFWLPEILNRLNLPDCIMRKARRDEVANLIRKARRDGIPVKLACLAYGPFVKEILKRSPRRAEHPRINRVVMAGDALSGFAEAVRRIDKPNGMDEGRRTQNSADTTHRL